MRSSPSQAITVSLPASMLEQVDATAQRLGATRSELFRAALRSYLRQLEEGEALLARIRAGGETEEELATKALEARRARRSRLSA